MPGDMSGLGGSAANNRIGKSEQQFPQSQMHTSSTASKDSLQRLRRHLKSNTVAVPDAMQMYCIITHLH
jgi:hypothetical protein